MKKLFITASGAVSFDPETQEAGVACSKVESIRNIYLMKEPTHVVYEIGDKRQEIYAEPDDLVIVFYREEFPNRVVVAKSAQWVDNINAFDAAEQKRKEEWAAKHIESCKDCDTYDTAC